MPYRNYESNVFVNFSNGKLVLNLNKNSDPIEMDELYDLILDRIYVDDAKYEDEVYKAIFIKCHDIENIYLIKFRLNSGYGNSFCCQLPNFNVSENFAISGKVIEKSGKKHSVCFLKQNGNALKWFFTKDDPKDLPALKEVNVGGKIVYDNSEREKYFIEMIDLFINIPKPLQEPKTNDQPIGVDDLPF